MSTEWPVDLAPRLANLDQLPPTGATIAIAIGILRLKDGSGSPVKVLAFVLCLAREMSERTARPRSGPRPRARATLGQS